MRLATHRPPGLVLSDHEFEIPVDHAQPDGEKLNVFAREIVATGREDEQLPWLVFFQGGPGFEGARPTGPKDPAWLEPALKNHRLLMLDQRGTGRSTPADNVVAMAPEAQADYLKHFRADSIVRDAEFIRREFGVDRWSALGQSFGGFCVTAYLSLAPGGLAAAYITGGLPPVDRHIDDVYRATYERTLAKNHAYYERYPEDRHRVRTIVERLDAEDTLLPSGDPLTAQRFRQLGHMLGMSDGAEKLHYILELPFGSRAFLHDVQAASPFARNPLYAVVHEACYASGSATRWSAERVIPDEFGTDPTLFTGEHIYPWMFEEISALRPFAEAAHILSDYEWPGLYDPHVLHANEVPVAAAIYVNDMYVERAFSEETAATIRGLRSWITSEYEHDGLRADARVLARLLDLVAGRE
ncbi:MAG: alpha/beta fold hydrolase [Actinomycetota bacterium]